MNVLSLSEDSRLSHGSFALKSLKSSRPFTHEESSSCQKISPETALTCRKICFPYAKANSKPETFAKSFRILVSGRERYINFNPTCLPERSVPAGLEICFISSILQGPLKRKRSWKESRKKEGNAGKTKACVLRVLSLLTLCTCSWTHLALSL